MKELQINLTITALTLVLVCSIGALADSLSQYLDKPGNESLAAGYKLPASNAVASVKSADTNQQPAPAAEKVAM